jgi:transcriptional regulator with XRE-family HTH domain
MDQTVDNKLEPYLYDSRFKIGEKLKEFREKRGYSQDELAEIMNITRSTISKIENGRFAFTIDYLSKLGWHLNFDINLINKT